jgi:putative membrane protein
MIGLLVRWLVLTAAILLTAYLLDGIHVSGFFSAFFAAAILGVLNVFLRPFLFLLTLPINMVTFGLFTFVINAMLLMMASGVISGFNVAGFWAALLGSLLISVISWILNTFITEHGRFDGYPPHRGRPFDRLVLTAGSRGAKTRPDLKTKPHQEGGADEDDQVG